MQLMGSGHGMTWSMIKFSLYLQSVRQCEKIYRHSMHKFYGVPDDSSDPGDGVSIFVLC